MRQFLIALVLCVVIANAAPVFAVASAWPFSEERAVVLGYGSTYTRDAKQYTHSGVDIAGSAGDPVLACVGGAVSFAGRIPCAGGGSALAATVELPDGRKLTVMPLASVAVVAGETVERGHTLGTLAEGGDSSCAATHVHVSLRLGELYEDPAGLLLAPAALSANHERGPADSAVEVLSPAASAPVLANGAGTPLPVAAPQQTPGLEVSGCTEGGSAGAAVGVRGTEVARAAGWSRADALAVHGGALVGEPATPPPTDITTPRAVGDTWPIAALCRSLAALAAVGAAIAFPASSRVRRAVSDLGATLLQPR